MSILNGVYEPTTNNNSNKNKGNNNGNKKFNTKKNVRRNFDVSGEKFSKSSYLPEGEVYSNNGNEEEAEIQVDNRATEVLNFIEEFTNNVDSYRNLQEIMINDFPDVVTNIKAYYSPKNSAAFQDALNKLIKLACTTQFANTLNSVLESRVWNDSGVYGDIWDSIGFLISISLETNHTRMHTETIQTYASGIMSRMYDPEINDIRGATGISPDLALDLLIALPVPADNWNGANMTAFYHRFLDKMLFHAEDNADVLNWEIQGTLYEKFFGKAKDALKVIGKYLTSEVPPTSESDVVNAVYDEFEKMIYSKLDDYDIDDIEYVISFVAKNRENNPDKDIMFNSVKASEYDNVKKALLSVMDKNPDSMKFLA